jgi:hypothetical protein
VLEALIVKQALRDIIFHTSRLSYFTLPRDIDPGLRAETGLHP